MRHRLEEILHDIGEAGLTRILGDRFMQLVEVGIKDGEPRVGAADIAC